MILSLNVDVQAQTADYFDLKDSSLSLDCSDRDTNKIKQNILFLQSLDTARIDKNKHWYYYDLSMAHFKLYTYNKDSAYLRTASQLMLNANIYKVNFYHAVYNLALFNYWLNEFDWAESYCKQYLSLKTDKHSQKEICKLLNKIQKQKR